MWPLILYVGLVLALFVRFQDPGSERRRPQLEATPDELRLVRRHHRVFYALLLAAPIEWLLAGQVAGGMQIAGALLFVGGLIGYRRAGDALGEQLSPLVAPREPATLVDRGPYRWLRHPMYVAELAMAWGAALMLGSYVSATLAVAFVILVLHRVGIEERLLHARLPGYRAYVARTKRFVPYVY